jgi:hypothetical protein
VPRQRLSVASIVHFENAVEDGGRELRVLSISVEQASERLSFRRASFEMTSVSSARFCDFVKPIKYIVTRSD